MTTSLPRFWKPENSLHPPEDDELKGAVALAAADDDRDDTGHHRGTHTVAVGSIAPMAGANIKLYLSLVAKGVPGQNHEEAVPELFYGRSMQRLAQQNHQAVKRRPRNWCSILAACEHASTARRPTAALAPRVANQAFCTANLPVH